MPQCHQQPAVVLSVVCQAARCYKASICPTTDIQDSETTDVQTMHAEPDEFETALEVQFTIAELGW